LQPDWQFKSPFLVQQWIRSKQEIVRAIEDQKWEKAGIQLAFAFCSFNLEFDDEFARSIVCDPLIKENKDKLLSGFKLVQRLPHSNMKYFKSAIAFLNTHGWDWSD